MKESDTTEQLNNNRNNWICPELWTGEPGGQPSLRSHRVGHAWSDLAAAAWCRAAADTMERRATCSPPLLGLHCQPLLSLKHRSSCACSDHPFPPPWRDSLPASPSLPACLCDYPVCIMAAASAAEPWLSLSPVTQHTGRAHWFWIQTAWTVVLLLLLLSSVALESHSGSLCLSFLRLIISLLSKCAEKVKWDNALGAASDTW